MKTLKFKCTLLSDVILNARAATTGPNETLDFIPGSNFLGIVASSLYDDKTLSADTKTTIFHSGKVRFGDAHPSRDDIRGLKVPVSLFYPKLKSPEKELYVHYAIPENADMSTKQLKQCRRGFYAFSNKVDSGKIGRQVGTSTSFALKSAYDRKQRRSKDEQLFGYQSLDKGLTMYFSVEFDDDIAEGIIERVKDALVKGNRIGRSRSAQYGHVSILPAEYSDPASFATEIKGSDEYVTVYADSRLIFLDEYGQPTFHPTAAQLGLEGEIDWEKSQIRTFRYAPWNFKRECFDTDRCGIEKGSVFVVSLRDNKSVSNPQAQYVGSYRNEGFGRVIYNPAFLEANSKGEALYKLVSDQENKKSPTLPKTDGSQNENGSDSKTGDTELITYLLDRKKEEDERDTILSKVNLWIAANKMHFEKGEFASQWGQIRSLATSSLKIDDLHNDLFNTPKGYLEHGIAKDKWSGKRHDSLDAFIEILKADVKNHKLSDTMACLAVVNLASEMGKKCRDHGHDK